MSSIINSCRCKKKFQAIKAKGKADAKKNYTAQVMITQVIFIRFINKFFTNLTVSFKKAKHYYV